MTRDMERVVVGRYRLVEVLGEGGMGAAWRARDERMRRDVVLKQLKVPPTLDARRRGQLVARMEREARAAGMLKHPGIVTVYDQFHDQDGLPWIVLEYVHGLSLADLLERDGPQAETEVLRIGAQIAAALAAAHQAGIVHRDIKPANVLVEGERVVVTDFGIAAVAGDATLTAEGMLLGTPAYMAPEQVNDHQATPASDMWSLGATLYAAVEGRRPFTATNMGALLLAVSRGVPTQTTRAHLLKPILHDLMNPDPGQRPTATQAATILQHAPNQHLLVSQTSGAASDRPAPAAPRSLLPAAGPGRLLTRRRFAGVGAAGLVATVTYGLVQKKTHGRQDPPAALQPLSAWRNPTEIGKPFNSRTNVFYCVAFSPDGKTLAAGNNETVLLWDTAARTRTEKPLAGPENSHFAVAFSPDGRTLATSMNDGTVRLWDVAERTQTGKALTGHNGDADIISMAFSPDGRILATSSKDETTVRLWDVATRTQIGKSLTGHTEFVLSVAFSPDGKILATGSSDKTVLLWDVATRTRTGKLLTGHADDVASVDFSPDGKILATGSFDATVRLWDVAARTQIGKPLMGHTNFVFSVNFSPDGKTLATGSNDNTVRLWDVATRTQIASPLTAHTTFVKSVAFSPDGKTLASLGYTDGVRLWRPS
ncbi:WD40 repeat domain-containing serine/threonine protein kinase [Actinomadura sp. 9N407]|uniref:WD40 repeat domain-containing serine/threonine protein kinase n=1 Tax=Actinomadura sp. 9N407 TaxID=3375154 RepID=UPI00379F95D6